MMKNLSAMNVYEMYESNGSRADFFIRRETWGNTIARVLHVAGQASGPLAGVAPYFERQRVIADFYDRRTGEWLNEGAVSSPGTYAYSLVADADLPSWARATR